MTTKTTYISLLSIVTQAKIKEDLVKQGLNKEEIETAMSSRLCDLEDTIDINKYL